MIPQRSASLLANATDAGLAELIDQLTARLQAGEPVDFSAVLADHPEYAERLQGLLPTLNAAAVLADAAAVESLIDGDRFSPNGPLGDFRIIREVGRGGMGVVYEAEQLSLGRRVALKVLPFAATMDPRHLQRFQNEARAAASLEHQNIVPVYGVGCERGVHYYAMKFIEGQTLAELLSPTPFNSSPSPLVGDGWGGGASPTKPIAAFTTEPGKPKNRGHYRRIAELMANAADALDYAHSMGVVHRDVKPGNLMLDAAGKLWVADFGLAKLGADPTVTMTGDVLGTLRYMSPEQALAKHGLVDHRTDIYSLGATLYELLTLHPAVDGADKAEILKRIAWEEPTRPRKHDESIPTELETITLKCLAKQPGERYVTAGELASDLRRWLGNLTIKARPPGLRQRVAKWARRHAGVTATAGISTVLLLSLLIAGLAVNNILIEGEKKRTKDALDVTHGALDLAFQSAKQMLFDVSDAVGDAPGLEQTQRKVVQSAVAIYEGLADYKGNAPEVERDRGLAQFRLGMIHDRLGDLKKGGDAYTQAADIFRRLTQREPNNAEYRYWQAHILTTHAELCDRQGRHQEADSLGTVSLEHFEQAYRDFPHDPLVRAGLANCCLVVATVNYLPGPRFNYHVFYTPTNGDGTPSRGWRACVGLLRRALELYPQVIRDHPGTSEHRLHFYRAQKILSQMPDISWTERDKLALESIAGLDQLIREFPREHRPRTDLCEALAWWTNLMRVTGRPAESELALRRAIKTADQLAADFPKVPYYQMLRGNVLGHLGIQLAFADRSHDAISVLTEAVNSFEQVPESITPQFELLDHSRSAYFVLGVAHELVGQFAGAEQAYLRSVPLAIRQLAEHPTLPIHSGRVQASYHQLATVHLRAGRPDDAVRARRGEVAAKKQLADAHPDDPLVRRHHGWALSELGHFLKRLERYDEADQTFREAQEIFAGLDEKHPTDRQFRDACSVMQYYRALNQIAWRHPDEAVNLLDKRVAWLSRHPDRAAVANAWLNLGEWLEKLGRPIGQSVDAHQKAIKEFDQLAKNVQADQARMKLAFVLQRASRAEEANQIADQAVSNRRNAAASGQVWKLQALALTLSDQAMIRRRTGQADGAVDVVNEAVSILNELVDAGTSSPALRVSLHGHLASSLGRQARLFEHLGRLPESEAAFQQAGDLCRRVKDEVPMTLFDVGQQEIPNAIAGRLQWANSLAELGAFHLRHGQSKHAAERCAEALAEYERTAADYPFQPNALGSLARFLVICPVESLRDPKRAVGLAEKAVLFDYRDFYSAVETLGIVQYRAGNYQVALSNLVLVPRLRLGRDDPNQRFFRAMARWQLGQKNAATRDYEEAVCFMARDIDYWELEQFRHESAAVLGIK